MKVEDREKIREITARGLASRNLPKGDGREELLASAPPPEVTRMLGREQTLFDDLPLAITVRQALSDLPPLEPGEDESGKDYASPPSHPYQQLMRPLITPAQYLEALRTGGTVRPLPPDPPPPRPQ